MSYDLFVWAVDQPLTAVEAAVALGRMVDEDASGAPADPRLAAFVAEMELRHPWLSGGDLPRTGEIVFELGQNRDYAAVGIGWSDIEAVGTEVQEAASRHDLLVYDPQRIVVGLPERLGGRSRRSA